MTENRKPVTRQDAQETGSLRFLYEKKLGRACLKVLTRPAVSKVVGCYMNSKASKFMIKSFVRKNNIDLTEYEERRYHSYNDFFTRQIKPDRRQFDRLPGSLISPCDSKLSAYPIGPDSVFTIKDSCYTVRDLLGGAEIADAFNGGYCLIFRLTVDDYHRYCYLDDGTKGENFFIKGELHTVKPIALRYCNIYKRNCREYTVMETKHFGRVVYVEVGAMMVGRIKNHHQSYSFSRGEEKGMFEFGGSTIVVLLEKDRALIDGEILENTCRGMETIVRMGERIGVAVRGSAGV